MPSLTFWDRHFPAAADAANFCGGAARESFSEAVAGADLLIIAVSSGGFAEVLWRAAAETAAPFIWLTKGFCPQTNRPLSAVAAEIRPAKNFAAVSGPSFAAEVAAGKPAALAIAAPQRQTAEQLRGKLFRKNLRLYVEDNIAAVCICGAVKNIIAIAAGICDGMQLGENARAALITRGLAEMSAVCEALGGESGGDGSRAAVAVAGGLAGAGDLLLTCVSPQSRNRQLGFALGQNAAHRHTPAEISQAAATTCEGAAAAAPVLAALAPLNIQTPIIAAVGAVLKGAASPAEMAEKLLSRPPAN